MLQQRHLRRFNLGLIASQNQHNRRRNQNKTKGAEEEPKGRSKKSFQENSWKKRPGKKKGISNRRLSGNIIPPLTLVEESVLVELKSVEKNHPVHPKQLRTHLVLAKLQVGLVLNFGLELMKDGITRVVNGLPEEPRAPKDFML